MTTTTIARQAKESSIALAATTLECRNQALLAIADGLRRHADDIRAANDRDLAEAADLEPSLRKRLRFDDGKISDVISGLEALAALPDPLGVQLTHTELAPGLELRRLSCPIGVIGVIFESRPDALVQISALCLKSGNAVLLKGGREAINTNRALAGVIASATSGCGIPDGWISLLETREDVAQMLTLNDYIDLIVPRGSNAFVKYIIEHTTIPVMGHAAGLCHLYIDAAADADMAAKLAVDCKAQSVAVCNAIETLLIHREAAPAMLPEIAKALSEHQVELRGDERARAIVPWMKPATDEDWSTEYLDYILAIKVVDSLDDAIGHINHYGSRHTEAIVTNDEAAARRFLQLVDAADVFWNASTRFADGFRFGLGAEVGIATAKIHARGPVGLEGLTIYKWILTGHGDTVAPFANGQRHFTHRKL